MQLLVLAWWSGEELDPHDSKKYMWLGLYAILVVIEFIGAYARQVVSHSLRRVRTFGLKVSCLPEQRGCRIC